MKRLAFVIALSLLAHADLPKPDARGEYSGRTLHTHWKVVDPDPAGLNGRLSRAFPQDYSDIRQEWPEPKVSQWPVVATFLPGSRLTAKTGNLGVIRIQDPSGKTWLMVERPQGTGFCFVRAHQSYIRPIP
jgi:hypothetical protein